MEQSQLAVDPVPTDDFNQKSARLIEIPAAAVLCAYRGQQAIFPIQRQGQEDLLHRFTAQYLRIVEGGKAFHI